MHFSTPALSIIINFHDKTGRISIALCALLPPSSISNSAGKRRRRSPEVNKITFSRSFTNKIKINNFYNFASFLFASAICSLLARNWKMKSSLFFRVVAEGASAEDRHKLFIPDLESMLEAVIYGRVATGWLSFCLNLGKLFIRIHGEPAFRPATWPWSRNFAYFGALVRFVTSRDVTAGHNRMSDTQFFTKIHLSCIFS